MLYVCVRGVMDVVFFLYCDAWSCRCSCMGSMSVSSCRCCMFVSCVLCASCGSSPCCGSGAFSLEEGRIAPLPLPRHVVRGDYLECLAM